MGFRERWVRWRNARLADPRFQSWAARFPLTRPVARRQSAALFDTVAGFVYSQILSACVELDLFKMIGTQTITIDAVAAKSGLSIAAARRLLKAGAALDLFEALDGERFALGPQGAALLGNPGIAAMVAHHRLLYADLSGPVTLLHEGRGRLADYWPYDNADSTAVAAYSELMAVSQQMVAAQVLASYDFGRHRHLLDVGGGEGAFLAAVAAKHPALELSLFDIPAVAERARERLDESATICGGSFLTDPLPQGADVISLVRIVHDHDDASVMTLFRAAAAVLPPGGTLLIAEPMSEPGSARRMGDAYFGMYLLAMGSGRPRTAAEIGTMLSNAGFKEWRLVPTPLPIVTSIVVAQT